MKKNERLEQIRKSIPQSVKYEIDELIKLIDNAYELGCRDTEQKLNIHGVMQGLPTDYDISAAARNYWRTEIFLYAKEDIAQDSFEKGARWVISKLSSSPTVGKAGEDASVSDGK